MKKNLSIENCNPLNIRWNGGSEPYWKGQCGVYKGFVKFVDDKWGYRAASKILLGYIGSGLTKPRQIIERWAPPSENDTAAYIRFASCHDVLVDEDLRCRHDLKVLMKVMTKFERGPWFYDRFSLERGFELACKTLTKVQKQGLDFLLDNEIDNYIFC